MTAAVADFAPLHPAEQKVKREAKSGGPFILELAENPDILKTAALQKTHQKIIGFALETENGVDNARRKLSAKHLDMIVLNNPSDRGRRVRKRHERGHHHRRFGRRGTPSPPAENRRGQCTPVAGSPAAAMTSDPGSRAELLSDIREDPCTRAGAVR